MVTDGELATNRLTNYRCLAMSAMEIAHDGQCRPLVGQTAIVVATTIHS
jgi:hypothetical protein